MKEYATIMPYMNQLELHPLFSSPKLRRVAKEMGCKLTGYGSGNSMLINHEYKHQSSLVVNDIVKRIGKSPMQIVIRWTLQKGISVVPRSTSKDHIKENSPASLLSWELSNEDMTLLDGLNEDYPYYWDPLATELTIQQQAE